MRVTAVFRLVLNLLLLLGWAGITTAYRSCILYHEVVITMDEYYDYEL